MSQEERGPGIKNCTKGRDSQQRSKVNLKPKLYAIIRYCLQIDTREQKRDTP